MGTDNANKVYMSGKATMNTLLNIHKVPDTKSLPIGRANAGLHIYTKPKE